MTRKNAKSTSTTKKQPSKRTAEIIKEEIIKECKKLALHKVSSAYLINEKTKELLRLEEGEL